jgi:3-oxoacyl-(acyl-carrier-protein) synthase
MVARGRAAITGIAASTWLGTGIDPLFEAFAGGLYALRRHPASSNDAGDGRLLALRPASIDSPQLRRRARTDDRLAIQLVSALETDLLAAVSKLDEEQRARTSVVLGNPCGSVDAYRHFYAKGTREGPRSVNPADFPGTLPNYQSVQVSTAFGITGANATLGSGHTAGLEAIGYAANRLCSGKEDFSLAGGVETANPVNSGLVECGELLEGVSLPRPLHADRPGTVLGEGIGILYLERQSGQDPPGCGSSLGTVLGHASAGLCAAEADSDGLRRRSCEVLTRALAESGLDASDVDAVFPSANGTPRSDSLELEVLNEVFGPRLRTLPIYPAKAVFGECFAASGPLQCIAALYAINHSRVTASGDTRETLAKGETLYLPEHLERCEHALVYSIGMDGTVSALTIGSS